MKKTTFLCVWAMLFPLIGSYAQENKALQVATRSGSGSNKDYRIEIDEIMLGDRNDGDTDRKGKSFTFAGWFNLSSYFDYSSVQSGSVVLGHRAQGHCNYNGSAILAVNGTGTLWLKTGGDHNVNKTITGATVELNKWVYLALQYDNAAQALKVFKDGRLVHTENLDKQLVLFNDEPTIFAAGDAGYAGLVDELHYFNKAISEEEMRQAYEGDVRSIGGLTGLWDFNKLPDDESPCFDNQISGSSYAEVQAVYMTNTNGTVSSDGGVTGTTIWLESTAVLADGRAIAGPEPAEGRSVTIKHIGAAAANIMTSSQSRTSIYSYTIKVDGTPAAYTEKEAPGMSAIMNEIRSATLNTPVPEGAKLTVEVEIASTYASFYQLLDLTANGEDILATRTYTVGEDDVEIEINVNQPAKLQVTIPEGVGYTLTRPSGETVDASYVKVGETICLTITSLPDGKEIDKVTTDGIVMGHIKQEEKPISENYYEFKVRYSTTYLDVTLKNKPCAVSLSVQGNNKGTLTAAVQDGDPVASGETVDYGTSIVLTAEPAEGYELKDLTVDGQSVKDRMSDNTYTFTVTGDHNIVATFDLIDALQTAAADDLRIVYAAGQLRIEGMPAGAQAAVYSLTGAQVKVSAENVIDLSAQPAGCYLVKISGKQVNKTLKFIKK